MPYMVFYYIFLSEKDKTKYKYCIKNILRDSRITSKKAKMKSYRQVLYQSGNHLQTRGEKGNPGFQRNYSEIIKN